MTLTEFLLARIAEDEANVRGHAFSVTEWDTGVSKCPHPSHRAGHSATCWRAEVSARVLAECDAKRRLLGHLAAYGRKRLLGHLAAYGHEVVEDFWDGYNAGMVDDLRFLALPYADHPDYRGEWQP